MILAVAGTLGASLGGELDDAIGPRRMILASMIVLLVALIVILMVDRDRILYVSVRPRSRRTAVPRRRRACLSRDRHLPRLCRWSAAGRLRTLLIRLAPRDRITQYVGLSR